MELEALDNMDDDDSNNLIFSVFRTYTAVCIPFVVFPFFSLLFLFFFKTHFFSYVLCVCFSHLGSLGKYGISDEHFTFKGCRHFLNQNCCFFHLVLILLWKDSLIYSYVDETFSRFWDLGWGNCEFFLHFCATELCNVPILGAPVILN